jgi:hypothetical protein
MHEKPSNVTKYCKSCPKPANTEKILKVKKFTKSCEKPSKVIKNPQK